MNARLSAAWAEREPHSAWVLLVFAAAAGSVAGGVALGSGHGRFVSGAMLPLAAIGAAVFAWLVFARFELFVLTILAIRAALDAFGGLGGGLGAAGAVSVIFLCVGTIWLFAEPIARRVPVPSFVWPVTAFVGAGALSILVAKNQVGAIEDVIRFATLVLIVLVLNQLLTTPRALKHLLVAVYLSLAIPALVGAYQVATKSGFHVSAEFSRVRGTFDHPNPFSIYLTMLIVMGVALLLKVERRSVKLLLLGAIGLCGVFLLLTYTRSAWIATVAGLLVVAFFEGKRLLPFMGFAVVLVVMLVPSVAMRFSDLSTETTQSGAAGNSLVWRFEYWQQALQLSENPIVGAGLRTVQASTDVSKEPHNDFIRVYVETGLIGLSAYLWFLFSLARSARRSIRNTRSPLEHSVAVGFAGCLAAFLLLSLVSNVISQLVILWYFLAFAVAAAAGPRLERRTLSLDEGSAGLSPFSFKTPVTR
jgi:putative inorganic carbon (HCO3(-)) transporter